MARLRQQVRLPLIAVPAGGVVGILGSYLYWTCPRCGSRCPRRRLADFGVGGVRTWSLVLALAVLVYGALVLRSRSRTSTQGEALVRLGIGLAVLPPIWALTLVLFLDVQVSRLGQALGDDGRRAGLAGRGACWAPSRRRRPRPGRGGRCCSTWP